VNLAKQGHKALQGSRRFLEAQAGNRINCCEFDQSGQDCAGSKGVTHVAQNVMDRLRFRREQFNYSAEGGLRSAGYEAGKISLQEITPEVVAHFGT